MRRYILSDEERRMLKTWIDTEAEDQTTRNLFTVIRDSLPRLMDDILLIINTRKKLKRKKRWAKRQR